MELFNKRTKSVHHIHFFILTIFLCLSAANYLYADNNDVHIAITPAWVKNHTVDEYTEIPIDKINNGIYYQLIDKQIKVTKNGERTIYTKFIKTVANQAGVDEVSQINIDYDPTYQALAFNSLSIIRDGQEINKLETAKFSVFALEKELENQIYNGSLTLNVLIDDIRVGDSIVYSFTREGLNPIYDGIFSYTKSLNWSVPVHNQYMRVLWGKDKPLNITTRNIEPKILENKLGGYTEYIVHLKDEKPLNIPDQLPYWYNPYGSIFFSESKSWAEVVDWAVPLYQQNNIHPSVQSIADKIKLESSTQSEQITLALKFTQQQIRYVGIELGVNSHLPTPANETVKLRYGDCKDKTVLLISILKAVTSKDIT